jgi:hypothetical protein
MGPEENVRIILPPEKTRDSALDADRIAAIIFNWPVSLGRTGLDQGS